MTSVRGIHDSFPQYRTPKRLETGGTGSSVSKPLDIPSPRCRRASYEQRELRYANPDYRHQGRRVVGGRGGAWGKGGKGSSGRRISKKKDTRRMGWRRVGWKEECKKGVKGSDSVAGVGRVVSK